MDDTNTNSNLQNAECTGCHKVTMQDGRAAYVCENCGTKNESATTAATAPATQAPVDTTANAAQAAVSAAADAAAPAAPSASANPTVAADTSAQQPTQ